MKFLRAGWTLARASGHALAGWFTIVFIFPRLDQAKRDARVQVWSLQMLTILGVRLELRGNPPVSGPILLVANHISWLDILVMHAARHCRFVAKSEVRHWPLIGTLAQGGGTLFIERESRRDAMRVVHTMANRLNAGDVLAVFPEGTTGDGSGLLPFHSNLIQAAISAGVPVQPVALAFIDHHTGQPSAGPRYVDEDTLVGSVWRTLSGSAVVAQVAYGQPEAANGRSRRDWARDLRSAVGQLRGF